jgi:hypothetical protein
MTYKPRGQMTPEEREQLNERARHTRRLRLAAPAPPEEKFLELTAQDGMSRIRVDPRRIHDVRRDAIGRTAITYAGHVVYVRETPEQIDEFTQTA